MFSSGTNSIIAFSILKFKQRIFAIIDAFSDLAIWTCIFSFKNPKSILCILNKHFLLTGQNRITFGSYENQYYSFACCSLMILKQFSEQKSLASKVTRLLKMFFLTSKISSLDSRSSRYKLPFLDGGETSQEKKVNFEQKI